MTRFQLVSSPWQWTVGCWVITVIVMFRASMRTRVVFGMDNNNDVDEDTAAPSPINNKNSNNSYDTIPLELWQQCTIFLAPTPTMNWGVYANIDIRRGDIVDVAGITIPMAVDSPAVERSILQDYVYGYWRLIPHGENQNNKPTVQPLYSVLLGYDMYYNHNATPNIEFQTFGREPQLRRLRDDVALNAQGFVALRDIARGEELWSTYKNRNEQDGGIGWFHQRGVELKTLSVEDTQLSPTQVEEYSQRYCSKITATISAFTWQQRVMSLWPPSPHRLEWMKEFSYLPPMKDAGWGQAYAKVSIASGQRVELSTALVMSYSRHVQGTALRPISYTWHDLYPSQRQVLQQLRDQHQLTVQYQGPDTDWKSIDGYDNLEDVVLFPAAGNIGMVQRKAFKNQITNCHLVLHPPITTTNSTFQSHPLTISVTIELIATRDVKVGDILVVDVPILPEKEKDEYASTSSTLRREYGLLFRELQLSGQLFEKSIFRHYLQGKWESPDEL